MGTHPIFESDFDCLTENMENDPIPGATSLNDLRTSNSDPFNKFGRLKRFFLDDSFRAICIGFALSSLALTIIMIFDANLGDGPIPQHGAVVSSSTKCTELGYDFLKKYRNSYDTAILTALCLTGASTAASLGGSGVATVYRIGDELPVSVLDYGGTGSTLEALAKLKERSESRWVDEKYSGGSFSEVYPSRHQIGDLAKMAASFVRDNFNSPKSVKNLRQLEELGVEKMYNASDIAKADLTFGNGTVIELSNGQLQSNDRIALVLMKSIDLYEKELGEDAVNAKSARYPAVIASAMFETGRKYKNDNFSSITEAATQIAQNMADVNLNVQPRRGDEKDQFESPFKLVDRYQAAYVTVLGDDNEMIALTLTVGTAACAGDDICRSDFGPNGFNPIHFSSPLVFRPACGTCGRHTTLNGDMDGQINFGAHTLRHVSLKATWATLSDTTAQKLEKMPPGKGIGWSGAVEWRNDEVHAIADKRDEESWPAKVI